MALCRSGLLVPGRLTSGSGVALWGSACTSARALVLMRSCCLAAMDLLTPPDMDIRAGESWAAVGGMSAQGSTDRLLSLPRSLGILRSGMAALLGCGSGVKLGTRLLGSFAAVVLQGVETLTVSPVPPGIRVWGTGSWAEVVTSAHGCPSLQGAAWVLPPRPLGLEVPSVDGHPPSGSLTGLPWNLRLRRLEPGGWLSGRLCCPWVAGAALVAAGASTVTGSSRMSSLVVGGASSAGTSALVPSSSTCW